MLPIGMHCRRSAIDDPIWLPRDGGVPVGHRSESGWRAGGPAGRRASGVDRQACVTWDNYFLTLTVALDGEVSTKVIKLNKNT